MSFLPRILLVTNIFPPMIGGPATFIDRLARRLSQKYRVTVVCSSEEDIRGSDSSLPFRVVRCSMQNRYLYEIKIRIALFIELLRHKTILVNGLESYLAPISRLLGRRYILKVVGDSVWERERNLGKTSLGIDEFQREIQAGLQSLIVKQRERYLSCASTVVTPSIYLAKLVEGWGIPPAKIQIIPNGVEEFARSTPESKANRTEGEGPLKLLFIGRLTNWKGLETLLVALKESPGTLTICGDGPGFPAAVALVRVLDLDSRVTFRGRCTQEEVQNELRSADALILPSLYEGLSHTLLDALAAGCPCIATAIGGNGEVITDGVHGFLIPPLNVEALIAAIKKLSTSPLLRRTIEEACLQRAKDFSFEKCALRYGELLEMQRSGDS